MKSKILILCILCTPFLSICQSNFVPAIIVKNDGDSLNGKIDFRNWGKSPESIIFIGNSTQREEFDASTIKSFFLINEKERYVSNTVSIDKTPDEYVDAISNRITKSDSIVKQVFLLQLVKDTSLTLLQYNDGKRSNFYYQKNGEQPIELIFHYLFVDDGNQVQTIDSYKKQLVDLFSSCPDVLKKINGINFIDKDLKNITVQYLNCVNPTNIIEIKKADRLPIKLGIVGGIAYNSFKFEGNIPSESGTNQTTIALDNYKNTISPILGVSLDIGLKRKISNLHFVNELIYKNYSTSASGFVHTILYDYSNNVDFSFTYLHLNSLIRYLFQPGRPIIPFVNIGIGNSLMIKEGKNVNHVRYSSGLPGDEIAIDGPNKHEVSYLAGFGLSLKNNIQFEARYVLGNGFSPYTFLKSKVNSLQLVATFQL